MDPRSRHWRYYRAVALDLDGTIACGGAPEGHVLAAIDAARADGIRVVLATGRILAELEAEFAGLIARFDAVCAENGAVLAVDGMIHRLARPVDARLARRLTEQGVAVRSGEVLLACGAEAAHLAMDAIHQLQLDAQLVRNREALMILPAGVTKGTGVIDTLGRLGISPHSAIGVGDAENDHALLAACELGVAVANAVAPLADHADLVLAAPNGTGVAELLTSPLLSGVERPPTTRWRLELGPDDDGRPVTIPAAQTSILVTGESGAGKSYLIGLLAEQLIGLGYTVAVIDPEGDHTELGKLHNVLVVGGTGQLPAPADLVRFIRYDTSVVVDLSLLSETDTAHYVATLTRQLERHRQHTGLPHWIVLDEAHGLGHLRSSPGTPPPDRAGYCLATYRPEQLAPGTAERIDWHITVAGPPAGEALLHSPDAPPVWFTITPRTTEHVRHQHKYTDTDLPLHRGFHFRTDAHPTGFVALNLRQFVDHLRRCDPAELRHHAAGRDLARWIRDVHRDDPLADRLIRLEGRIAAGADPDVERTAIVATIEHRYGLDLDAGRR